MTRIRRIFGPSVPSALICGALLFSVAHAGDWARWRGPGQDGIAPDEGVFRPEGFSLEVAWNRPLGIAFSGIAVVGDRAVTMFGDGDDDWLTAVDATSGAEIWRYRIDSMFPKIGGSTGGPLSMPVIHDGVVYGLAAQGHLFAVRLEDGVEIWTLRIDKSLGARAPRFGFTTSPLVVGDLLFVEVGGDEGRAFAAFDRESGKLAWSGGDDSVGYHSPILGKLAGKEQILAVSNTSVSGLDPKTGKLLWSREHGTSEGDGFGTPILLGDDKFVVSGYDEAAAFRVEESDSGIAVEEVWRSNAFKRSFATPVYDGGHLYGFSGDFLTCIDATNGEKVWKSRPPGGRGLILVDGHLIIFAGDGSIVAAEASPEGYREKARVKVSKNGSYTYPSFAAGSIFVRNSEEIARVGIGEMLGDANGTTTAPVAHEFDRFLRRVEKSDVARLMVDEFMASQTGFPIVENDEWVHFVYRGDAEDVAINGTMAEYQREIPMDRLVGTDLYYKSFPVDAGSRLEYRFNVDFENPQPDPLNPRRVPGDDGDMSELVMAGHTIPEHVRAYQGAHPGRMESFKHESEALGNERDVEVYLPPGYDSGDGSYPVAIFADGKEWVGNGNVPNSLNHLIGDKLAPIIAVFVDQPPRSRAEFGGEKFEDYVRMLADELVPALEARYRTAPGPESRAVLGKSRAAVMAAYAVVARPDVFGMSGGHSAYLDGPLSEALLLTLASGDRTDVRFSMTWNRYELHRAEWGFDMRQDSRRLSEALAAGGYEVSGGEVLDSAGWGGWRTQTAETLERFFPR